MVNNKQIKLSEVIELFEKGYTREEIGEKFGLTNKEVKYIFKHPLLAGKRQRERIRVDLIDDVSACEEKLDPCNYAVAEQVEEHFFKPLEEKEQVEENQEYVIEKLQKDAKEIPFADSDLEKEENEAEDEEDDW